MIFQKIDQPTFQIVYDGSGKANDHECEFVVLLDQNGEQICRLGFDNKDFSLVNKSYWGLTPMGEGNVEEVYSDYSEVSGIKLPMKTVKNLNGQKVSTFEISEIKANEEYPASTFEKPE
jgi:hypothetical protein